MSWRRLRSGLLVPAAGPGVLVAEVAQGSLSSTTTSYTIDLNATIAPGNYVCVVSVRHTTTTGSRAISDVLFVHSGGTLVFSPLVSNSRTSGGAGVVGIYGVTTTLNESNVDVRVIVNSNMHSCQVWLFRVDGLTTTSAHDTGQSDGSTFTLNTTETWVGVGFVVLQGASGITYMSGIGAAIKSAVTYNHESGFEGQCWHIPDVTTGLGETTISLSGSSSLSAGAVIGA